MTPRPVLEDILSWPVLQCEPLVHANDPLSAEVFAESLRLIVTGISRLIRGGHLDLDQAHAVFNNLCGHIAATRRRR